MIHCSTIRPTTHHLLHLDFDKVKQCLQMEIDELSRNLENKNESQKATAEKLNKAKRSCEALKKKLEGLDAKEYGTKLEVMLILEKDAAAERIAASQQSFKDTSKAKEYQHRKDATRDKVNGLILARRASYHSNDNRYAGRGGGPFGEVSYNNDNRYSGRGGAYNNGSAHEDERTYGHNDGAPRCGHGGDGSACDERAYGHKDGASCCGHGGTYNDGLA
jgi:hypothetical protein